jgi:hypothetical protein
MEKFILKGKRVLLDVPQKKESAIQLSEKDEEHIMKEAMKLWTRLNVFAVGDTVEGFAAGAKVYCTTSSLEHSEKVEIDGSMKLMVGQGDIAIIWE